MTGNLSRILWERVVGLGRVLILERTKGRRLHAGRSAGWLTRVRCGLTRIWLLIRVLLRCLRRILRIAGLRGQDWSDRLSGESGLSRIHRLTRLTSLRWKSWLAWICGLAGLARITGLPRIHRLRLTGLPRFGLRLLIWFLGAASLSGAGRRQPIARPSGGHIQRIEGLDRLAVRPDGGGC